MSTSEEIIKLIKATQSDGNFSEQDKNLIDETLKRANQLDQTTCFYGFLIVVLAFIIGYLILTNKNVPERVKLAYIGVLVPVASITGVAVGRYKPGGFNCLELKNLQQENTILRKVIDNTLPANSTDPKS